MKRYSFDSLHREMFKGQVPTLQDTVLRGFLITKIYIYLSIWLDQKLAFKFHINTLVSKLRQTIGYLYRSGTTCSA